MEPGAKAVWLPTNNDDAAAADGTADDSEAGGAMNDAVEKIQTDTIDAWVSVVVMVSEPTSAR
jgi:hypothetical protein